MKEAWEESLDIVVVRSGVERYRWLCSDENKLPSPNDPATWRRWVVDEAQRDPSLPNIDEHLREASALPARVKPCGGCP
jgi:hypothetical protein